MTRQVVSLFPAKRLKHVVSLRKSRVDGNEDDRPYVGLENIESWTGKLIGNSATDEASSAIMVEGTSLSNTFEPGDVLFGKLRPYLAKVWVAEFPGRSTTELLVMHPVEIEPRFLRYVCLWHDFVNAVDASTFGSRMPRADWDFIGNMSVPIPEWRKQRAIANYLDRETARLDALVAEKKRLLDLLADKRRALITHAVTLGLNPNVPLRESGIPWLEKIPVHWETRRLKFLSPQITVGIVVTPAKYYEATGVPCLRSLNVREHGLSDADLVFISEENNLLHSKSIIRGGDLVAVRSGQPGTTAVVDQRFDGANCIDLIIIRRSHYIDSAFLAYFLNSDPAKMQFLSGSGGAIQQHFNIETASGLVVPLPPLQEQRDIVAAVSKATAKVDALSTATRLTIALLRERRSTLIAGTVTGQINIGSTS